jgi:Type I restriction modification DNA specificity domain
MELTNKEWKEFSLTEVFKVIQRGRRLKKGDHTDGNIPYASSTALNNGIDNFIGNTNGTRVFGDCLTIANSGSVGSTFFQPFNVVASDHVTKLENKNFNKYTYLFLATMTSRVGGKYGFNREINDQRVKKEKILLPVNSKGKPDYIFMESYMKQKEAELLSKYKSHTSLLKQSIIKIKSEIEWKEFKIGDIFSVSTGTLLAKEYLKKGKTARLTATDNNNGIFDFYEDVEHKSYRVLSNFISISFLGSVFYHPYSASLDMKIHAVQIPNVELNRYIAEFLVFCFKRMAASFSYGDQLSSTDLPKKKILLPINDKGEPDYFFMESYMKTLEYEKLKQYLDYKKLDTSD